jgi:hypothetical protein
MAIDERMLEMPAPDPPVDPEKDRRREDLAFGQIVTVTARWVLVLAGFILTLWIPAGQSSGLGVTKMEIGLILALAIANFYLHLQLLTKKRLVDSVAYLTTAGDLIAITALILATGGLHSYLYIFYFPAFLALAVAFPTAETALFAGTAAGVYGFIGLFGIHSDADARLLTARLIVLAAVAVCGNVHWRSEGRRRREAEAGHDAGPRTAEREAAEDVFFGREVLIWARWFVIITGTLTVLWSAASFLLVAIEIVPMLALIGLNFYLHARFYMERPDSRGVLFLASMLDLAVVTMIVCTWAPAGLDSPLFVLYYPLLLGFGLVFPRKTEAAYTGLAVAAFAVSSLLFTSTLSELGAKQLVLDCITLAATGALANYYWRILRSNRREDEAEAEDADEMLAAA